MFFRANFLEIARLKQETVVGGSVLCQFPLWITGMEEV